MCVEGARISAAARVVGASAASVSGWVKKGAIALDEMWTYLGARKAEKRNALWVWTAVLEERDGSRWMDFEVGGRDEATFLRLLERPPDAERYESDAYYGVLCQSTSMWLGSTAL